MPEELKTEGTEGNITFTSPEAVPTVVVPTPEGVIERAPETAPERAREKFSEILAKTAPTPGGGAQPADDAAVSVDAKAVYDETDAEARVTKLISLAQVKGIPHAVKVAEHLDDYYVLDRMHDELADKFYDALKAKGMLSE
jgi:hypothetical protein